MKRVVRLGIFVVVSNFMLYSITTSCPYEFTQACQRREECWRSLSLLIYAVQYQHELRLTPQHTLEM